jgi:hypothetical protein
MAQPPIDLGGPYSTKCARPLACPTRTAVCRHRSRSPGGDLTWGDDRSGSPVNALVLWTLAPILARSPTYALASCDMGATYRACAGCTNPCLA